MPLKSPEKSLELAKAWAAEIRGAEDILYHHQDTVRALAQVRGAAKLAAKIGEPTRLRRTAAFLESLGGEPATVARIRKLAEKNKSPPPKGGEPAALIEAIGFTPEIARQTIFKYLDYSPGPSKLRKIHNKAFIACTSRTGSTLLCTLLQRAGINAQEHFNIELAVRDASFAGEAHTIREYADKLGAATASNGWFVTKGALETLLFLCYLGEFPEQSTKWKFIYIRRRNFLRQAVSMDIATRTQQWHANQPARDVIYPNDYSFDSLWKHLQYIFAANSQWERAFALLGIAPHRISFEELIATTGREIGAVMTYLGVDRGRLTAPRQLPRIPVSQSTDLNDLWERRFRRDLAHRMSIRQAVGQR